MVQHPGSMPWFNARSIFPGSAPSISITFLRLVKPCTIRTAACATQRVSARYRTPASFAFIDRRRRQAKLVRLADLPRQLRLLGAGLDFYDDAGFRFVHRTSARRLATPAIDFASAISN